MYPLHLNTLRKFLQNHPGKAGTLAGWFQQACSAGIAILLVPVLLSILSKEQAGIWFSFQGFVSIANLTDFGFGFAISRQIACCLGQKSNSVGEGDFLNYGPGWTGIRRLMRHAATIYRRILLVSIGVSAILFEIVLPHTMLGSAVAEYRSLWYFMAASTLTLLTLSRFNALLIGLGHVYLVRVLTGLFFLLQGAAVALVAWLTKSLPTMAAASFVAALANWIAIHYAVRTLAKPLGESPSPEECSFTHPRLFRIAAPIGVVNLSGFLVSYVQVPLIGAILGPANVAPFYLAQKIGQFLNMIAMQLVQPRLPIFTRLLASGDRPSARDLMLQVIGMAAVLTLFANAIFFFFSPFIAHLFSNSDLYPDTLVISLMTLDFVFVGLATTWGHFVLASGKNPFVLSTVLHGVLNLVFLTILMANFGLSALPISALLGGLLTNYWFNPYWGLRIMNQLKS